MGQFDWLIAAFPKTVFTVFDTETTGLDPKLNRVAEIGGIKFDALGIISRFNVLIDIKIPMPPEITKINGITDEMLSGNSEAKDVLPDFIHFIGNTVLIAHNAPFDINFVNEELSRNSLAPMKNIVLDTRIFAKEVFPDFPKYSLQELAVRFGIEAKDAHRAEDDARVCMELFLICLKKLREKNPDLVKLALEESLPQKTENTAKPAKIINVNTEDLFADDTENEEEIFDETPG